MNSNISEKVFEAFVRVMSTSGTFVTDKEAFRKRAQRHRLRGWKNWAHAKALGLGVSTGIWGGPVGFALEGIDLLGLLALSARTCFGIGHIIDKRDVDYENDVRWIIAAWSGVVTPAETVPAGKVGIKIGMELARQCSSKVIFVKSSVVGGRMIAQKPIAMHTVHFGINQISAKASTKLVPKVVTKAGSKWIPVVGGVASGGINVWLLHGFMDAAEEYYLHDKLILNDTYEKQPA